MLTHYKKIILLIFLLISRNAISQLDLLEEAYQKKSTILLDSFITNWMKELPVISNEELSMKNDTIKKVYELFSINFDPQNISKLSDSSWNESYRNYFKNLHYAIVPNEINYSIVDEFLSDTWLTNPKFKRFFEVTKDTARTIELLESAYGFQDSIVFRDSITNFQPDSSNKFKFLYKNNKYDLILNEFIFNSTKNYIFEKDKQKHRPDKEILKRVKFLKKRIPLNSPSSYAWNLFTDPIITSVNFTRNFQKAKVWYMANCNLWVAIYEYDNGQWKYLKRLHKGCWCG